MNAKLQKVIAGGVVAALVAMVFALYVGEEEEQWPGYIEGEYVWVALPEGGTLETLDVARGAPVEKGQRLYGLESIEEQAAYEEARFNLEQARASRDNLLKGLRDSEIQEILSMKKQAEADLALARVTLERKKALLEDEFASREDVDQAQAAVERAQGRVEELEARLVTANLPAREDEIAAANARLRQAEASLQKAEWRLSKRTAYAPADGYVFDTFFQVGEFIKKGQSVVSMLPPENVKIRFYLPQSRMGELSPGDRVMVHCDGCGEPFAAIVNFMSDEAEFTPPVIFSEEAREKLTFLVEAKPASEKASELNPGQPVSVILP